MPRLSFKSAEVSYFDPLLVLLLQGVPYNMCHTFLMWEGDWQIYEDIYTFRQQLIVIKVVEVCLQRCGIQVKWTVLVSASSWDSSFYCCYYTLFLWFQGIVYTEWLFFFDLLYVIAPCIRSKWEKKNSIFTATILLSFLYFSSFQISVSTL